jgi:type IV pilus assembly protein PilN
MRVIQQLQESRPEVVHLFDELVNTIPEGVYLTKANQSGRSIVVEGQAQSNARVSAFMRNIEASSWLGNPRLLLIEQKGKGSNGLSRFQLRFDQKEPRPADDGDNTKKTGGGKGRDGDRKLHRSASQGAAKEGEGARRQEGRLG